MTFEFSAEDFLRVAEALELVERGSYELYPYQRDVILTACVMLRSAGRRLETEQ